ncbi:hypothetical protein EPN16_08105 [bacterium]|nr:MAG: hypothetical protein EPN16_08105 [bacterium]
MNNCLHLNKFLAIGVGSLPHTQPVDACELVFGCLEGHIPFWPQLPKMRFRENMYAQFSENLPGLTIDEDAREIYINTAKDTYARELEAAYEHYLAEDLDYFAITEDYAAGLYEFIRRPSSSGLPFIKGQVIGPISFGLTVTDQNKRASIYNEEFRDCLIKVLAMRARWQIRKLRGASAGRRDTKIIIFIDEPYLVSIGSSFFGLRPEAVSALISELVEAIHKEGAFAGIHCCGNTDWGLVLKTAIDILNFDAYNYPETIFLYRRELDNFLERGGVLAWGIVPSSPDEELPGQEALLEKMARQKDYCLVSPSCGLSGVSLERARKALEAAAAVAERLSEREE